MLKSLFFITRPGNVLIASASVWLGAWVSGAKLTWDGLFLDGIILGLLAAAGNIHNDIVDLPIDRINRPNRPIPSRQVELWAAWFTLIGILIVSLFLLLFRSPPQWIFSGAIISILYLYNVYLKGMPLVGNLAVSALCASALWMPALDRSAWTDISTPDRLIPLVFFSFLFTFARELIKDIEDIEGDRIVHHRTFPLLFGISISRLLAIVIISISALTLFWPWLGGTYPGTFVLASLALVYPFLLLSAWHMRNSSQNWHSAQKQLKYAMIGGIAASVLVFRVVPLVF